MVKSGYVFWNRRTVSFLFSILSQNSSMYSSKFLNHILRRKILNNGCVSRSVIHSIGIFTNIFEVNFAQSERLHAITFWFYHQSLSVIAHEWICLVNRLSVQHLTIAFSWLFWCFILRLLCLIFEHISQHFFAIEQLSQILQVSQISFSHSIRHKSFLYKLWFDSFSWLNCR